MKKYRPVNVSEKQLEDLIRQAPELIEDGLQYVDHQRKTNRGPLDVLMLDRDRAFVVAELKVVEDDAMLVQGIDYYDHVVKNFDGIARAYKGFPIDAEQDVRLMFVAPSFSIPLLNRCKWIDIPLSLYTYKCISLEGSDDVTPVYSEVTFPSLPETEESYTIEDHVVYITDAVARARLESLLQRVRDMDTNLVTIEPKKAYLSAKVAGTVFSYIKVRRSNFVVATYDQDGTWVDFPIVQDEDVAKVLPLLEACVEEARQPNA